MSQAVSTGAMKRSAAEQQDQAAQPPRGMDLKKITTPILLHLLARELRFPGCSC
jgi:hypothetical protein